MEAEFNAQMTGMQNSIREREIAYEQATRENAARIAQLEATVKDQQKALYGNTETLLNEPILSKGDD